LSVRIYSLAKELNLDSKVLVDACNKAGVTGKGSALASLSDDEVTKLKNYLGGGPKSAATSAPPERAESPPSNSGAKPAELAAIRREDYISPAATVSKPPVLGAKRAGLAAGGKPPATGDGSKVADKEKNDAPTIRLGRMPTASSAPASEPKSEEPAPQKPDIKLPLDAIRAKQKGGSKPLEDLVKRHEEKRKSTGPKTKPGGRAASPSSPAMPAGTGAAARERGRRHKDESSEIGMPTRDQRQLNRKRAKSRTRQVSRDDDGPVSRRPNRIRRTGANTAAPRKGNVVVELPCTVRSFCEALGVPARVVLGKLLALGIVTNIAAPLDAETAELLAAEMEVEVNFKKPVDQEVLLQQQLQREDDPATLQPRPPIVTFLGHVDHGKTSLLDRIIGIDVVSGESGGITQHIRAYRIERDGRAIAFVDTPGHEAFTAMRARGANVTDLAVLVVAADDGIMPQTEEAISHARAAGVPIVVALNKIDLPGVDENRIFQQLAAADLLPTEWGGDTEVVKTSAVTGDGIDELLETLLTVAELHEYKANPDRPAFGTCLEAEQHEGRGVVAKLLVQKGQLRIGDVIVCGAASGRIREMYDTLTPRETHEVAGPSTPVNVTGLDVAPGAGDRFYVLDDISHAREIADKRSEHSRQVALGSTPVEQVTLENLFERLDREEVATLNLILRADTRGSIEAIQKELTKLDHPEVQIKILQATVGGITEADVHLAHASRAVIMGFNVVPDEGARSLAEQFQVQVRRYDIIYKVTEDLKAALEGMLKPEKREKELGRALVQRLFVISRMGTIAGCRVLSGTIERNCRVRVIRENRVIGEYPLDSLRREKDDAREVREGFECGMKLAGFNDIKEGDILEAYKIEEIARTL